MIALLLILFFTDHPGIYFVCLDDEGVVCNRNPDGYDYIILFVVQIYVILFCELITLSVI